MLNWPSQWGETSWNGNIISCSDVQSIIILKKPDRISDDKSIKRILQKKKLPSKAKAISLYQSQEKLLVVLSHLFPRTFVSSWSWVVAAIPLRQKERIHRKRMTKKQARVVGVFGRVEKAVVIVRKVRQGREGKKCAKEEKRQEANNKSKQQQAKQERGVRGPCIFSRLQILQLRERLQLRTKAVSRPVFDFCWSHFSILCRSSRFQSLFSSAKSFFSFSASPFILSSLIIATRTFSHSLFGFSLFVLTDFE